MTLPSEYQEVEYIQSSGTQYINTGYQPSSNTEVEGKVNIQSFSAGNNYTIYGARNTDSGASRRAFAFQIDGDLAKFRATIYSNTGTYDIHIDSINTISTNTIYTFKQTQTNFYLNGTSQGTYSSSSYSVPYNMYIFAYNIGGSTGQQVSMRLYSLEIKDNGTLVRNFIPCYRKSDSVIGLYDLVNDTFYTNSGTGTFTKGPDVVPVPTYKLHGAIQTFHYQFSEPEREPNSNTIFYLPFTEDILDHSGNNHTLTANGSNYTFTTRSNGAKCMSLNNGGGTTYFSFSDAACKRAWSQSRSWGYKISDAVLQGSPWGECSIFGYNGQMKLCTLSQVTSSGYNANQLRIPGGWDLSGASNTGTTYDSSDVRATSSTEHTIVFTFDANTKTFKRYLDGVLFYENVFTAGPSQSASYCYICRDGYDTESGRYLRAKISHIVYEDGVWDDNRIQLYTALL